MSQPVPYPKDRAHLSLPELIDRYQTAAIEEAPGLIRAIARHSGQRLIVTRFLIRVGNEVEVCEPDQILREEARTMLARKVLSELLKYPFAVPRDLTDPVREMVALAVDFFAKTEKHADVSERDRKAVHEFLARCWQISEGMQAMSMEPLCPVKMLVLALVHTEHFACILEHGIASAIPLLFARLRSYYTEDYRHPRKALYSPRSIWLTGDYTRHTLDRLPKMEAREIVADLVYVTLLCGMALKDAAAHPLAGCARTLLTLVARDLEQFRPELLQVAQHLDLRA